MRSEVRTKHIEPLWDRVDANRLRLAIFLLLFFLATTLSFGFFAVIAVLLAAVLMVGSMIEAGIWLGDGTFGLLLLWTFALTGAGVLVYMTWALTRDERWFARRLGAELVPRGDLMPTKYALKDMAIASGFDVAPAMYVIETPNVNAFVYQRGHHRAIVGVTRGLTTRMTSDEQRAVFANLMARLQQGDMLWASAVTALMSPMWRMRDKQLDANEEILYGSDARQALDHPSDAEFHVSSAEVYGIALLSLFAVISELLAYGHRSSQLKHAETADAEGMLLLKDPRPMLSALEKSVRFNNFVPTAGPGMTQLFYAWTGESTDDEEDPEMRRVTRLREVLGVEGMELPVAIPNESTFLVAPPAPRIEERERTTWPAE